jgi:hypothetical protein
MSKPNKVNKDHYVQRGRLTPDELARERARQIHVAGAQRRFSERAKQETGTRRGAPASTRARSEREEEE